MPPKGVRPTQDRVREALFAILGRRVRGARFLDLCAGSGAVGLEAWSRGADFVCWVENDRRVFHILRENVRACCDERIRLVLADAGTVLRPGFSEAPFDLVYADPPYAVRPCGERPGLVEMLFHALRGEAIMAGDGILILEQASAGPAPSPPGWALAQERVYGRSRLCFFHKER